MGLQHLQLQTYSVPEPAYEKITKQVIYILMYYNSKILGYIQLDTINNYTSEIAIIKGIPKEENDRELHTYKN